MGSEFSLKTVGVAALFTMTACAAAVSSAAGGDKTAGAAHLALTLKTDGSGGAVMIALFADAESYASGTPIRGAQAPVASALETARIEGLAPGYYAIRAFHDRNGDGELNANPFGAPIEPFAFSNDAKPSFGPPDWEAVRIQLAPGDNVETLTFEG